MQLLLQRESSEYYVFWMCVGSLRYPACNAHAPYCHLSPCPALSYFPTLSYKRQDLSKKKLLNIKYVFWFSLQLLSETFLISRRTERDMIKNVLWSSYKVPVNLDIYERSSNFLNGFSKNVQIPNFIKIRPCGQTDMTRLVVVFRKIANASKNC